MKRLLAGVLAICLLALTGLESYHAHATVHEKSCAACTVGLRAAGVALRAPPAPAPKQPCVVLSPTSEASAPVPVFARTQARAPPAAA